MTSLEEYSAFDVGVSILTVAREYLDLSEIVQNREWSDAEMSAKLREMMLEDGDWQPGWSYCASFAKACWVQGYIRVGEDPVLVRKVGRRLTPSVMQSYTNVLSLITRDPPLPGAIGFMRKGKQWLGHEYLVVLASPRWRMLTLEGNTMPGVSEPGKQREGDGIYPRADRKRDFTESDGLHLLGFLNPLDSVRFRNVVEALK